MESQTPKRSRVDGPIRLTNKTALALRRSARQARTLALWQAVAITVFMAFAAVLLGIRWLPAVPLTTGLTVLLDAGLFIRGRAQYLSLTGEALCAEAAARTLRAETRERERAEQARRDLDGVKEDVRRAVIEAAEKAEKEDGAEIPFAPASGDTRALSRDEIERLRSREKRNAKEEKKAEEKERKKQQTAEEENQSAETAKTAENETPNDLQTPAPPRRRRRQASLTVLRAEDAK